MGPGQHVIISGVTAAAFYSATHSMPGALSCWAAGVLIDVDHLLDYFLVKKKVTCRLAELHHFCGWEKKGRLLLIFHSYELLVGLALAIAILRLNWVWVGALLGMTVHLLSDHLTNPIRPLVYFFTYRFKHRFSRQCIFYDEHFQQLV